MRKNLLSKALSIITAALVGAMSVPFIPSAAAEVFTADMVITEASATAFTFEASKNIIETGETLLVSIYDTSTGEKWDGEELPEYIIEDESVLSVSGGGSNGTFVITGLTAGTTYIRFTNEDSAYADFKITVKQAPTGSTTAAAIIGMSFEPSTPQLAVGETITIDMFWNMSDNPYTGAFPTYIIDDPSIVSIAPGQTESTLEMTGLSAGTTKIHFVPLEGTADMRVIVTEDGTVTTAPIVTTETTTTTAYPYTTTTDYAIQLACSEENVTLYPGHTQSFYLYYKTGPTSFSESYPVTFEFENEGIAAVTSDPYGGTSDYVIEALSTGTTKLTIKQQYGNDTLTCEMNITVQPQTTTTAPVTNVPSETTYITTAAPALMCSPSAVTVEAGKRQPIIMSYANGMKISQNPTDYESDNAAVAEAEQGEYSYICYIEGISEGTANITITPPYGYDPVTIPVTVIPADDNDSNDVSVHIVIEEKFYDMIPKGGSLDLSDSIYSVYKYDGTSTSMEKVLSKVSMSAETENVTVDASAFDSSAPGYYDIIITYADDDGYTDTVTLCAAVYYFEGMDTTTTPVTTTTTTRTTSGIELDRTELTVPVGVSDYVIIRSASGGVYPRFEIEDESIVEITPDEESFGFYVKGLAEGTTTIKVIDGEYYSEIVEVTVVPYVTTTTIATTTTIVGTHTGEAADGTTVNLTTANTEITTTTVMGIVLSDSEIELEAGQRFAIGISKTDGSDYFDGNFVECTSDNPAVAVVQHSDIPYEIFVVGMAEGTANITVYDPAFGSTATLKVTVTGTADNTIGSGVSIVIDSEPQKLQYNIGEELDLTGGVYRVVMDSTGDNFYGPWDMTAGRIITDAFDNTTAGTYPIYISYNNPIYGYWDVYVLYVTVADAGAETTGDIDANGKIDLDDAAAALTCYAKNAVGIATTTPAEADVDGNGKVDLDDAAYILTYYARNAAGLPCTWDDIITG